MCCNTFKTLLFITFQKYTNTFIFVSISLLTLSALHNPKYVSTGQFLSGAGLDPVSKGTYLGSFYAPNIYTVSTCLLLVV